jgi:hypothetical protein
MLPAFFARGAAPGVSQIPRRWQAANCGIEHMRSAAEPIRHEGGALPKG